MPDEPQPVIMQAQSIYEQVKGAFFAHYLAVRDSYAECLQRQLKSSESEKATANFIGGVVALGLDILPKLETVRDRQHYAKLKKLDSTALGMTFLEAEALFRMEREFLEENGITKYEYAKTDPEEYTVAGMGRK
jgi:hypothetical protein